jgi:DNA-binding XRE family transcriptional regulator
MDQIAVNQPINLGLVVKAACRERQLTQAKLAETVGTFERSSTLNEAGRALI